MIIHYADYSSHNQIHYVCGIWTKPEWEQPDDLPHDVYADEDGGFYSFDKKLISCEECKMTIDSDAKYEADENHINDPALYETLSKPSPSKEIALQNGNDFYNEVCKLREKYHVPEMVISFATNFENEKGQLTSLVQLGYRGGRLTDKLILELVKKSTIGDALGHLINTPSFLTIDDTEKP